MLVEYVKNLEIDKILEEVELMLSKDVHPKEIQRQLFEGLKEIGKKYENGECFIGDLIVSGMMMKEVLSIEKIKNNLNDTERSYAGKIIIGTVCGDIHDIGKDIMLELFTSGGFTVLDLGVDVSPEQFVEGIKSFEPDIVGISCILTTSINYLFKTIKAIETSGLREKLKIIVGGTALDKKYYSINGADAFTNDAYEGLKICESWMLEKQLKM